ncbi:hypothetical protein KW608_001800 [Campylobacter coli]
MKNECFNLWDLNAIIREKQAKSLKDRKTMITDFYKKSEELRKHSNEEYNAKFEKITKQK